VLLSTASVETCTTLILSWQCNYISSRVRDQSHRLLQLTVRKRADNLDRQTVAGHERCRASHRRHTKTRPWPDAISTPRSTLAEHGVLYTSYYIGVHGLNVPQRITFKLCLLVFKCLHGLAPRYLAELCVPVADVIHGTPQFALCHSRTTKFSSVQHEKLWPTRRAFSYAGPHAGNSLPEHLRQTISNDLFKRSLKTFLFGQISRSAP